MLPIIVISMRWNPEATTQKHSRELRDFNGAPMLSCQAGHDVQTSKAVFWTPAEADIWLNAAVGGFAPA